MKTKILFVVLVVVLFLSFLFKDKIFDFVTFYADEAIYREDGVSGNFTIKEMVSLNKTTAVADGNDKIVITVGSFFISPCIGDSGAEWNSCATNATPENPVPACMLGGPLDNPSCIFAFGMYGDLAIMKPDVNLNLSPGYRWTDSEYNNVLRDGERYTGNPRINCSTGYGTLYFSSTRPGRKKIVYSRVYPPVGAWWDGPTYTPLLSFDVEFTPAPSPPPVDDPVDPISNTNSSPNLPTNSSDNSNGSSGVSSNPSGATDQKKGPVLPTRQIKGKVIKPPVSSTGATADLPDEFTIDISNINNRSIDELADRPVTNKEYITIKGKSNFKNVKLLLEIHSSDVYYAESVTSNEGEWSVSFENYFEPGDHTIFIKAQDNSGNIVVDQQELTKITVVEQKEIITNESKSTPIYLNRQLIMAVCVVLLLVLLFALIIIRKRKNLRANRSTANSVSGSIL